MSTKTTFKRIALVTVAALGFGVLTSVAPATAADTYADGTYTASVTPSTTSLTVVGAADDYGFIGLTATSNSGANHPLYDNETITVTVTGVPTNVDATNTVADDADNLAFRGVKRTALGTFLEDASSAAAADATYSITNASTESNDGSSVSTNANTGPYAAVYWLSIKGKAAAIDNGTYTLRIRLTDSTGFVSDKFIKVTFVSSPADSGAVITLSKAGSIYAGDALTYTTDRYVKAVLTDANGGRIQTGNAALTGPVAPSLGATIVDEDGAVTETLSAGAQDTGVAAQDHVAPTSNASGTAWNAYRDGTYGVNDSAILAGSVTAANTQVIRVRYGATSSEIAMTGYAAVTPVEADSTISVKATGITAVDQVATPYSVPLTTTSAVVSVVAKATSTIQVNKPITFTVTWSGNQSAGDVSPKSATPTTVLTDSSGVASITVTNKNPANGAKATVVISGFTAADTDTQVIDWTKSYPTTVTQSASQAVKIGATTVVTATVTDQFGLPVAGEVLQPAIAGANANTTALATVTTDATGSASISVTDAKGVEASTTLGSDTVAFSTTNFNAAGVKASGSTKLTYVAAVPVIAAMTAWYSLDETPAVGTYLPVPTAGITDAGTYLTVPVTRDNSKLITAGSTTSDDLVAFRISTGAKLVPVVITGTKGAFILGSIGQQLATRTVITDADGYADFVGGSTTAGANTFTATAGTVTVSASFWLKNAASAADARFVTLTGPATGTANGDAISFVATATDRYGNPISGVTLSVSATGAGSLAGGATLASFVTDSTGSFTFQGASKVAAGGSATYKVVASSPTADFLSLAGKVGTTTVESTVAAGNSSASVTVAYAAGEDAAAANAQAATDAAAEATDAANAATDAANAAAEAADAATAAAQDAADAVAALSTQVSEMVNALKKQITALTNLVIKIQKKVRA
jgi:hypothetical protein